MDVENTQDYLQVGKDLPEDPYASAGQEEPRPAAYTNPISILAFGGLLLFTLLLYARPNDLFPDIVGMAPITKTVAIIALLLFIMAKATDVRPVRWPLEMKAMLGMTFVMVAFMPLATDPSASWKYLTESWLKVVIIFLLLINLLTTRRRLRLTIALVVLCSSVLAFVAMKDYASGNLNFHSEGFDRVGGAVGSIFGDPNDLSTTLNMMIPLAVVLGLSKKGLRRLFWLACAVVLAGGITVTLSRGGFVGLACTGAFFWWKLFKGKRVQGILVLFLLAAILVPFIPRTTLERVSTLATPLDGDGSRQQRYELLKQGLRVAFTPRRLAVGLGFSNFVEVAMRGQKAHNSYVETLAELGVIGFAFYMIILIAPFRSLRRVERSTWSGTSPPPPAQREVQLFATGLQATLVAYMVCSCFLSIEYSWYVYYPVAFAVALRYMWEESNGHLLKEPETPDAAEEAGVSAGLLEGDRSGSVGGL